MWLLWLIAFGLVTGLENFFEDFEREKAVSTKWRRQGPSIGQAPDSACFLPNASGLVQNEAYVLNIKGSYCFPTP
jgi:hypothetical protein